MAFDDCRYFLLGSCTKVRLLLHAFDGLQGFVVLEARRESSLPCSGFQALEAPLTPRQPMGLNRCSIHRAVVVRLPAQPTSQ
eukprot:m.92382 g.92382  ORF g.92382 m.92382 type:complete len:82 (+) comp14942_c0_seq3:78-323(+)